MSVNGLAAARWHRLCGANEAMVDKWVTSSQARDRMMCKRTLTSDVRNGAYFCEAASARTTTS
jgi:hypothetical protein